MRYSVGDSAAGTRHPSNRPLKDMDITAQLAITICSSYLVFFTASAGSWPDIEMVMYRDHI